MTDADVLVAAGCDRTRAGIFAGSLSEACARFRIDTPTHRAAFLAQCLHESAMLTHVSEALGYSHAERILAVFGAKRFPGGLVEAAAFVNSPERLANRVYAGRNGNGDEASGDGWAFRGGGLIQLTGRANYAAGAAAFRMTVDEFAAWVRSAVGASLSAAWWWTSHGCPAALEADGFDATTRIVNGAAMAGREERAALFAKLSRILGA